MSNPVQPIRPAATVILVRESEPSFQIFMLKRTSQAAFASGMFVFPGGRVDGDDHLHKYDRYRVGPSQEQAPQVEALGYEWRGFWIAALRETFEEAGLILAYDSAGEMVSLASDKDYNRFQEYREPLHRQKLSLLEICQTENLKLAVDRVHFYNRFVTPLGRPRRFDTRFFIASAPEEQRGRHDEMETVESIWITPQEALKLHEQKEFGLMNVTRIQLEKLALFPDKHSLIAMAENQRHFLIRRPNLPPPE